MGTHGTPWDPHGDPIDFGFSGRPRERPTKTKIGRQGRISRLPEGSRVNGHKKKPYMKVILD